MPRPDAQAPPTIQLFVNDAVEEFRTSELLLGIEEEGVPVEISRHAELDPLLLAHQAATASVLGIGIGISLGYVVVTSERLDAKRPYLARFLGTRYEEDRAIGANAARLVKRVPLVRLPPVDVKTRKGSS